MPDLPATERFTPDELRLELACALFARRKITSVTGARMAGVDLSHTFQRALGERGIEIVTREQFTRLRGNLEAALSFVIVVADTSVIVNLVRVGHDRLLQKIYGEVWIPQKVADEFRWQVSVNPRFHGLSLPGWLQIRNPSAIPPNLRDNDRLDAGECAALALAVEIRADAILIDEENGTRHRGGNGIKASRHPRHPAARKKRRADFFFDPGF